jgi:methionine-gamma-lyase
MKHQLQPESLMMSFGYKPELSEGAIKSPIFQTSTFVFRSAEEGKAFFEIATGKREKQSHEKVGLIYSRMNNPDLEILENRLTLWDGAEDCAVFESGMAAISTTLMEFLKPGDLLLYSIPIYGGTEHFIESFLKKIGVHVVAFKPSHTKKQIIDIIKGTGMPDKLAMIFMETPANPTNTLIDIAMCREIADEFSAGDKPVYVACDNTYMGPLWQHPLKHGAHFSLYSATKYIGGHSDLIAGACLGSKALLARVRSLRTYLGNMAGPWTGWLMMRSLETLKIRMEQQARNAEQVAAFLRAHTKVEKVYFLGFIPEGTEEYAIYKKQYLSPGAMLSFDIRGGEREAFRFLNELKLIKLAVSLGSTESLAEHPATMTHAGISDEHKKEMAISEKLIRLSVGVENAQDIIWDLEQALEKV